MKVQLPSPVVFVADKLQQAGYDAYVVGGAVRDLLIDRPVTDWDFTTNAIPDQTMQVFKHRFYDNVYGTVGLPIDGLYEEMKSEGWQDDTDFLKGKEGNDRIIDVTTYRFESTYSDSRRPDSVKWGTTLADDVSRRDFTINALALNVIKYEVRSMKYEVEAEVIDMFGGQEDIKKRLIRAVGNPVERFTEDALRMMRAIRFGAQLGFSIESETVSAIKECSNLIQNISWERIRDELLKILKSPYPAEGILLLYNSGLLHYILPEMLAMRGIKQGGHHIYDVWNHSIEALRSCPSSDPMVRLATLLHDILVVLSVFAILGKFMNIEVDTLFVTALLTILSFSVHDTIVVYDRIRESMRNYPRAKFVDLVNKAINETLARSVNNSMTIIFMLLALWLLGGETTKWFTFALLVGTITGTYSSTFTAAPLLVVWDRFKNKRKKA